MTDKLARRQADFDNFRKRTERERSETYNRALGEVVRRLLPVLDNLQRALDAERVVEVKESEEFRHFLQGVELINRQLGGVLESLGVEAVPTVGELFDPHVHEAVATEETDRGRTRHGHAGDAARLPPRRQAPAPRDGQSSYQGVNRKP